MAEAGVVVGVGVNVEVGVWLGVGVGLGDAVCVGSGVFVGISGIGVVVGVAERITIISACTVSNSSRTRIRPRDCPALNATIRATTVRIPIKISVEMRALFWSINFVQ